MYVTQKRLTLEKVQKATRWADSYIRRAIKQAQRFSEDLGRTARLVALECPRCYYTHDIVIAGAAMTSSNCASCNKETMFGSTNVDMLCPVCAKTLGLCKHCGSDLELKDRQYLPAVIDADQNWPEPKILWEDKKSAPPSVILLPKRKE